METEVQRLADLCERVASGDPAAAAEFEREVLPLVEIMARRTLRAPGCSGAAARGAQPCESLPQAPPEVDSAELARRVSRSLVDRVRLQRERVRRDTLRQRPAWATRHVALN